jgi:2'-5' RNA ligase
MATSVYSLWLEPPPALASTSAGFIARYAGASGGRCPTFDPHVTLAGGFVGTEAQAKEKSAAIVASLASAFGPLRCDAMEVSAGTRFHQCVYLRMVPTEQLANAHALAARAFGLEPGNGGGAPYMPHLSLVYGQLTDAQREDARRDGETALLGNELANVADASFVAAEVTLWRTDIEDLTCESWSRVDRYPLKSACDAS